MDFSKIYNDPIIGKKRKGTPEDPFKNIEEPLQIINGKAVLSEIPNRQTRVRVTDNQGNIWLETNGSGIKDNIFKVDYTEGTVSFASEHNGKTLIFKYTGEGSYFYPSERIYLALEDETDIITLKDKLGRVDTAILEQKNRLDNQLNSIEQPSELVDVRVDANGVVYPVAKDRIDALQEAIEDAFTDNNGLVFPDLRSRINSIQTKIEDAYYDNNGVKHADLKARIGSEQTKIEETYQGSDGRNYESMSNRFNTIDADINSIDKKMTFSIATLKAGNYVEGEYVRVLGYYGNNDGGQASYYIDNVSTSADVSLDNGLFAHMIVDEFITPLQFGAKRDGVTDDYPAFEKALNKIRSMNGGRLKVPYGNYVLAGALKVFSNTVIECDQGTRLIRAHSGYMLMNGESGAQYTGYKGNGNILVEGGIWDGKGMDFTTAATVMTFGHGDNITIRNVTILDVVNNHAIEINSTRNAIIDNCKFLGFRYTAEREYAEAINIDKATQEGFPAFGSYDNTPCKNVTIQDCHFAKSETVGMGGWGRGVGTHSANQSEGDKHTKIIIRNNVFEDCLQWAVYFSHWDDSSMIDNRINNCGGGVRVAVANQPMYRVMISGNNIMGSGGYGLTNISIVGTVDYEIRSVDVRDNIIYSVPTASASGIYCAYCNGCKIDGNTIRNTNTDGIIVRYGRYYSIVNNSIVSCAGTAIFVWTNVLYSHVVNNTIGYIGKNGIHVNNNVDTIVIASNSISGVNGSDNGDSNHIRITETVQRVSLNGNVCRDIYYDYLATKALFITSSCTDIVRTGNVFVGIAGGVSDTSGSKVNGDLV